MPTIESFPTFPRRRRSKRVNPTTPTFLSEPEAPPPTKPVVYSPVPTMSTFNGFDPAAGLACTWMLEVELMLRRLHFYSGDDKELHPMSRNGMETQERLKVLRKGIVTFDMPVSALGLGQNYGFWRSIYPPSPHYPLQLLRHAREFSTRIWISLQRLRHCNACTICLILLSVAALRAASPFCQELEANISPPQDLRDTPRQSRKVHRRAIGGKIRPESHGRHRPLQQLTSACGCREQMILTETQCCQKKENLHLGSYSGRTLPKRRSLDIKMPLLACP